MDLTPDLEHRRVDLAEDAFDVQRLDVLSADGAAAVSLQITIGGDGSAELVAAILEEGRDPIGLVERDIVAPAQRWEVRASGLWADHVCETPLLHWSYGLEAFALAVDEVDALVTHGRGQRVPLGWEIEFEAEGPAAALGRVRRDGVEPVPGFRQLGRVHGILLDADGERPFDGVGIRTRWWGDLMPEFVGAEPDNVANRLHLPAGGDGAQWHLLLGDGRFTVRHVG